MPRRSARLCIAIAFVAVGLLAGRRTVASQPVGAQAHRGVGFSTSTGGYSVRFRAKDGVLLVKPKGKAVGLAIRELGGVTASNLLRGAKKVRRSGSTYTLTGKGSWASFKFAVALPKDTPGLIHLTLTLKATRAAPLGTGNSPDVRLLGVPTSSLVEYAAAAPVAGNAVYLGERALNATILYYSDYTALGPYFDRTRSGASQPNFTYPGAEGVGSLVGAVSSSFGYEPPSGSIGNLPKGRSIVAVDSYLYLRPGLPADAPAQADTYLRMISTVFGRIPKPAVPTADWNALAGRAATDLADTANLVTVNGYTYLRSYVSDTRTAPELITQAGVLAGIRAYEARTGVKVPLGETLDANLATFYDPVYHTVTNHLGHDPKARDESWYYVDNLISLLQLAQLGDAGAKKLLLDSVGGVIALARANNYAFPVSFQYGVWDATGSPLQPDVAGGYAWLMLGLYDLTGEAGYLDEAKGAMATVPDRGFSLAYELHMTAYTAAAGQRLYRMTGDVAYRNAALVALANLFRSTRLWDCRYGLCLKGSGYHTYMGIDPLPTGDYVAMLEQYEAWLGLRDYAKYDTGEPSYVTDLVQAFLTTTPNTMQYALPPQLPAGVAATSPGLYDFVKRNVLTWNIPLEDLREGELTSGSIGQEIYGAGGTFMFAAYAP